MKFFIVDDNELVRTLARKVLTDTIHGCNVFEFDDPDDAVKQYADKKPDLVLMDIMFPKGNGLDATKSLTTLDRNANIIVISQLAEEDAKQPALQHGARFFINKEELFNLPELIRAVLSL